MLSDQHASHYICAFPLSNFCMAYQNACTLCIFVSQFMIYINIISYLRVACMNENFSVSVIYYTYCAYVAQEFYRINVASMFFSCLVSQYIVIDNLAFNFSNIHLYFFRHIFYISYLYIMQRIEKNVTFIGYYINSFLFKKRKRQYAIYKINNLNIKYCTKYYGKVFNT